MCGQWRRTGTEKEKIILKKVKYLASGGEENQRRKIF